LFNNKSTLIEKNGESALILANWEKLALDGISLILTKKTDCDNISPKVKPDSSAVLILSQVTCMWESYVMPFFPGITFYQINKFFVLCYFFILSIVFEAQMK